MGKSFTIDNPMPPLWLMYPHITRYSIGWRMGYGESYKYTFNNWIETLSEDERQQYQAMFPKPKTWRSFLSDANDDDLEYESYVHDSGIIFWNKNGEPKYSKDWLINQSSDEEFVFFWQPGDVEYEPECCFGQWQYSEFTENAYGFTCTEQYMMAAKAQVFEDEEIEEAIMKTSDLKQMKSLGRKVKNFDEKTWDKVKHSIVLKGNYYKFTQDKKMMDILLATGNKILVEASPLDTIWGIGYSKSNPAATNAKSWRGLNLLGFALMEVRDEIKTVYQNYDKVDWSQFQDL
ncbi:NADAR family protein [Paenibacillus sp. MZ04-78.2]|uniref:NADAR family protein n=1 Tax=Paenibacillus sp. MZ04-78.2 TaxID=2962034 RepID=UPI0020B81E48|nr:NADAR family protein [Paenibacillus sp. MZ04-78.2]MCP3774930.1 NADAR family protein [Paenibacillus sp. MZ04-78.2]